MPHNKPIKIRNKRYSRPIRRFLIDHGWLLIGIAAIVVFCLGCFGFKDYYDNYTNPKTAYTCWDLGHMSFQLFRLGTVLPPSQKPWLLELARTLATLITLTAAIKALMLFFQEKLQGLRLQFWRNHVVICGLGEKGQQLALDLLDQGEQVVVIDQNAQNDKIRRLQEQGVIVLVGNAARKKQLLKAKTMRARSLFVVTPDDWSNLEIALRAHELISMEAAAVPAWRSIVQPIFDKIYARAQAHLPWLPRSESSEESLEISPRRCFVHLVDNELRQLFAQHRVFSWVGGQTTINSFNIYENAARLLFRLHPPEVTSSGLGQETVHLLIVGFGQMGRSVALQIAKIGHYAHGKPVRITVIDKAANSGKDRFLGQYPSLEKICAIDFITLETDSREFFSGAFLSGLGGAQSITQVIVCLEQESMAHACALHLLRLLQEVRCPIFVRVNTETHLIRLLGKEQPCVDSSNERLQRIHSFGSIASTCSAQFVMDDEIDEKSKQIHAAYCAMKVRPATDPAMQPWDKLGEDFKESSRAQAEHLDIKLRAVGCKRRKLKPGAEPADFIFTPKEIDLLAEMEHARWNAERFLFGWTLGERNPEKKSSPYLVDWKDLEDAIKEYDLNAVRQLPTMLAKDEIREEIVRETDGSLKLLQCNSDPILSM